MLALGLYRSLLHEACGGYLPDTTARSAEDSYSARDAIRCHLCTTRLQAAVRYSDSPQPQALMISVTQRR